MGLFKMLARRKARQKIIRRRRAAMWNYIPEPYCRQQERMEARARRAGKVFW